MTACARPGCSGTIQDGFCDVCGMAPAAAPAATPTATATPAPAATPAAPPPAAKPGACARPGCGGTVEDGFCDTCGMAPAAGAAEPVAVAVGTSGTSGTGTSGRDSGRTRTAGTSSARTAAATLSGRARDGSRGSSRGSSRRGSSRRGLLGAGLVEVPPVPYRDPADAVLANPEVAERKRFCSSCGQPVGRGRDGRPSRTEGFCRHCGAAYSFTPKLVAGDLVGGQYEVLGCIAHGGLGWIYLAKDHRVSDRWVVLKGLLDTGDSEAFRAAAAERRFLAEVEHPNIVRIYNFAEHPDPRTGTMIGYIVMEYVGGSSLKELRSERDPAGVLVPLGIDRAIAYALEVLPALGYLHARGLLYCDFKPDNVIQSEEQLRLIDLGAVRRIDDDETPIYKTDGYCAPELGTEGPSVSSDLYTVGRTLAVLTFNFDYLGKYQQTLPDAGDVPVLARHGSYLRFLERATDVDPDARFETAAEMVDQLTGVLREVMSTEDGEPRPALSTLFSPERRVFGAEPDAWPGTPSEAEVLAGLPVPQVDATDAAASLLATSSATSPDEVIALLLAAPQRTVEVRLRLARARIEKGDVAGAVADLDALDADEPGDWRVAWHRAQAALTAGNAAGARDDFDALYRWLPGEAATKLALAAAEEAAGNPTAAAHYYELVWRTDRSYVSAAFGLARVRLAQGDRAGAVRALESVPEHSSHRVPAQLAAIRAGMRTRTAAELTEADLVAAGNRLESVQVDLERRARLAIEVLESARLWLETLGGAPVLAGGGPAVLGCAFTERDLRLGLERNFRTLARLSGTADQRIAFVDRANSVRPVTWV